MERRTIAATAAAVFLTTAAGVLAVTANLGLLHVGAAESKVGTLSPVATPTAPQSQPATVAPVTTATPAPEPAPDPAALATPVADTTAPRDATWSSGSSTSSWSSAPAQTAAPSTAAAPAPPTTTRAAEPGDRLPATGGSGDD